MSNVLYLFTIGCTNQFVQVNFTSPAIVCTFLNATDTSVKSCTVTYGSCDQELDNRRISENSTVDRPNDIEIRLDPSIADLDCFMYVVRASNVTYTIIVEGTRSTQSGELSMHSKFGNVVQFSHSTVSSSS